jgi:hypothetical protein
MTPQEQYTPLVGENNVSGFVFCAAGVSCRIKRGRKGAHLIKSLSKGTGTPVSSAGQCYANRSKPLLDNVGQLEIEGSEKYSGEMTKRGHFVV